MNHFVRRVMTCLLLGTSVMMSGIAKAEVVLVGSNQIHFNQISKTKLRDLYTGQSQMVGNSAVLVIDRHDEFDQKEGFISKTLGFTKEEFQTVNRLLQCIGVGKAPTIARDSNHLIEILLNNPNALGYLTRQELLSNGAKSRLRSIKVLAE